MICRNCGVELENDISVCPLCGMPVTGTHPDAAAYERSVPHSIQHPQSRKQRKFTWEITSIILASAIAATFAVNLIISGHITWSEYTIAVGLVIFCYLSVFAFWNKDILLEMAAGFVLSSGCFLLLDMITDGIQWAIKLGIPLLLSLSIVVGLYIKTVQLSKYKGFNLIAYALLGAAVLCICLEAVIAGFMQGAWHLKWSLIVLACVIPVIIVLFFIQFRLKKGRDLEKTFHI